MFDLLPRLKRGIPPSWALPLGANYPLVRAVVRGFRFGPLEERGVVCLGYPLAATRCDSVVLPSCSLGEPLAGPSTIRIVRAELS